MRGTILSSFDSPGITPEGLIHNGVNLWNSDADLDKIYQIQLQILSSQGGYISYVF